MFRLLGTVLWYGVLLGLLVTVTYTLPQLHKSVDKLNRNLNEHIEHHAILESPTEVQDGTPHVH